jgi:hypothetical protein
MYVQFNLKLTDIRKEYDACKDKIQGATTSEELEKVQSDCQQN